MTTYRPIAITADREEVRAVFLARGWKGLEKNYGRSNAVLMQLIAHAGGAELLAERARVQPCGRRAGGKRATDTAVSNIGLTPGNAPETPTVNSDNLSSR